MVMCYAVTKRGYLHFMHLYILSFFYKTLHYDELSVKIYLPKFNSLTVSAKLVLSERVHGCILRILYTGFLNPFISQKFTLSAQIQTHV